jgi:hypothetical protein
MRSSYFNSQSTEQSCNYICSVHSLYCTDTTQWHNLLHIVSFLRHSPIYSALFAAVLFFFRRIFLVHLILREVVELWGTDCTSACGGFRVNYCCGDKYPLFVL